MHRFLFIIFSLTLFYSCSSDNEETTETAVKTTNPKVPQGRITYSIEYPEIDSSDGSLILKMLPNTMNMTYKSNRYKMNSEAGLGMFETGYICDGNNRHMDYYLRMPSSKMASRFNEKGVAKIYPYIPKYRVVYTDKKKTIEGLPSSHALVVFEEMQDTLNVWYCPSFPINDPNWCNPYHQITGLLVDYEIYQYGIRARMKVSNWEESVAVEDKNLRIDEDYDIVSNKVIQQKLQDMMFGF